MAVDNDEAGREFCQKLSDKGLPLSQDLPPLQGLETKLDWNDIVKRQKELESKDVQTPESKVKQSQPKKVNITSDYKQHLADTIAQNNKDISACQKQIEELHQLIDEKKIQNKKLQAISVAIDDL